MFFWNFYWPRTSNLRWELEGLESWTKPSNQMAFPEIIIYDTFPTEYTANVTLFQGERYFQSSNANSKVKRSGNSLYFIGADKTDARNYDHYRYSYVALA